jgi:hypothetical protein
MLTPPPLAQHRLVIYELLIRCSQVLAREVIIWSVGEEINHLLRHVTVYRHVHDELPPCLTLTRSYLTSLLSPSMLSSHLQLCIPRDLAHPVKYTVLLIPTKNMTISESPNIATNLTQHSHSYNKTNEMHYFSNLFWYRTLHVSERVTVHHQESSTVYTAIGICHTGYADWLLARSWSR